MESKFLINTITDWSEPPRARHQVTLELAKNHKVVFINASKVGLPGMKITMEKENLSILYPFFPISYKIRYRLPVFNEIYQIWLFSYLRRKYKDYQLINFDFSASLVHSYFKRVIYYCNDNFTKVNKKMDNAVLRKYNAICEEKVTRKAVFCVATSGLIKEKLDAFNPNVFEIPLGGPSIRDYSIPVPVINLKRPGEKIKLGLVGFMKTSNTSSEVINLLLETGEFEVNLIGPVDADLRNNIKQSADIKYLGVLVDEDLYKALNSIDVAIAPYHFNKLDYGGTPNKLLIYLALGKPTVVTYLKAIKKERYEKDVVYFVEKQEDFVEKVRMAYKNNTLELMEKRIAFAEKNSWAQRVDTFLAYLNKFKRA